MILLEIPLGFKLNIPTKKQTLELGFPSQQLLCTRKQQLFSISALSKSTSIQMSLSSSFSIEEAQSNL